MPARIPYYRPLGTPDAAASRRVYEQQSSRREDITFYQSAPWRKVRAWVLATSPLCERCKAGGTIVPAKHVHHRIERKLAPDLALDPGNLESLCHSCHSRHHAIKRSGKP